jgi:ankyrin repeat protein
VEGLLLDGSTSAQPAWQEKSQEAAVLSGAKADAGALVRKEVDDLSEPPPAVQFDDASARGDAPELSRLLALGVPADATMADTGMTPLMMAADAGTALVLIKAGADVNRADPAGWTSLHHAVTRPGSVGLVLELLQAGADAGKRNHRGETLLLLAGLLFTEAIDRNGGQEVIPLLVRRVRVDIDAWDRDGWTMLHQAASNDTARLARLCLILGADPDIATPLQETPGADGAAAPFPGLYRCSEGTRRWKGEMTCRTG